ncbi:UNVERIFIED_CONTAM: hypothetical protein FKN15_013709 [Acipenser sinensis]
MGLALAIIPAGLIIMSPVILCLKLKEQLDWHDKQRQWEAEGALWCRVWEELLPSPESEGEDLLSSPESEGEEPLLSPESEGEELPPPYMGMKEEELRRPPPSQPRPLPPYNRSLDPGSQTPGLRVWTSGQWAQ